MWCAWITDVFDNNWYAWITDVFYYSHIRHAFTCTCNCVIHVHVCAYQYTFMYMYMCSLSIATCIYMYLHCFLSVHENDVHVRYRQHIHTYVQWTDEPNELTCFCHLAFCIVHFSPCIEHATTHPSTHHTPHPSYLGLSILLWLSPCCQHDSSLSLYPSLGTHM